MATCPTCRVRYPDDVTVCPADGATLLADAAFSAADTDLKPGDVVGEYRIEGKLGEGGFGAVFRAEHPLIGKAAAVKVLHREFSANPQMVSRFIAEARAVNQIRHKNIIDIFSFGALPDGRQYYVMELLDGVTFDGFLEKRGRLPVEEALPILRGVARALDAAHKAGIAHRDLKPENVFLVFDPDRGLEPKLLDFGIAKLTQDDGRVKTRTGTPMGTPYYMSPEQARGQNVDARTDVYAFGVMCHQVLTGKLPFDGESVMDIFFKHAVNPPPRLSEHEPSLPPALDAPVLRMLAKDPAQRPATVGAALDELQAAAHGAGLPVSLPGGPAAHPSRDSLPGASRPPAFATTQRKLTPDELALASAKTVAGLSDAPPGPATAMAPAAPARRSAVVGIAAVVAGIGIAAASFLALRPSGGSPREESARGSVERGDRPGEKSDKSDKSDKAAGRSAAASAARPVGMASAEGAASAGVPLEAPPAESASARAAEGAVAPEPVPVTVETNVPGANVYMGGKLLGAAPGPVLLPPGETPVALTVRAQGYKPSAVQVVPQEGAHVSVTLEKRPASPKPQNKDLENPF